jgi:MFS family permease
VTRTGHLVSALADPGFRRLFATRLVCQFGDGVFQASLAGAVLFDPERQARAADVAAAFTVLLLPYSVIGPFAGVLLDRWWRQRVLVVANLVRAVGVLGVAAEIGGGLGGFAFYLSALVIISLSRFINSALSAAQPHVVADTELVTANAVATTGGALLTAAGGGLAIAVRALIGDTDGDYALIGAAALIPYVVGALLARDFPRTRLGPSAAERAARETPAEVVHGLAAGMREIRRIPPVWNALLAMGAHRLWYGIWTVCTVLLFRNYFTDEGVFRAGLTGLGQVVAAIAAGGALAALATPTAYRHLGGVRWPAAMLAASAVFALGLGLPYVPGWNILAALLLGFTSQSVKISVDTLVQHHVVDAYRGRVFAIYDMLFNVALVIAAVLTAGVLPENGHSPASILAIGIGWLVTAGLYLTTARRTRPSVPQPPAHDPADRAPSATPADADTPGPRAGRVERRAAT